MSDMEVKPDLFGHQVSLEDVLKFIYEETKGTDLEQYEILNLYLFGSRLFGTHEPTSDYDFICVIDGAYFPGPRLIEKEIINVNFYHVQYFQFLLDENIIWVLMTLYFPKNFIWMEKRSLSTQIKNLCLKKAVLMDCLHNYSKAKRLWKEGDIRKSKKNIIHGLRYLTYAQSGRIIDLNCENETWFRVMKNPSMNWENCEKEFKPIYTQRMQLLTHLLKPKQLNLNTSQYLLKTLVYIQQYGLECLSKELCVIGQRDRVHPNLLFLKADLMNSPTEDEVVCECKNLIIEEETKEIVCFSYKRFFNADEKIAPEIDWNSTRVYEKIDGNIACLYWYCGEWRVCSNDSSDGSDTIVTQLAENKLFYYAKRPCYNVFENCENHSLGQAWKFFDDEHLKEKQSCTFLDAEEVAFEESQNENNDNNSNGGPHQEIICFRDMFWKVWKAKGYQLPAPKDNKKVFMFELSTPKMKLVISRGKCYDENITRIETTYEDRLILHGVRDLTTLHEEFIEPYKERYGWDCVQQIQLNNPSTSSEKELFQKAVKNKTMYPVVLQMSLDLDPLECCGFILVDKYWNRLKVKSPQYNALRKLCWNSDDHNRNKKLMLEIIRTNDSEKFLTRFGKWRDLHSAVKNEYQQFLNLTDSFVESINHMEQRDFAAIADKTSMKKIFCEIRAKNLQTKIYFRTYPLQKLSEWMRYVKEPALEEFFKTIISTRGENWREVPTPLTQKQLLKEVNKEPNEFENE